MSEILSVDSSTAQQEPPRRARPERPIYPPADRAAVEESGTVKWYNAMKGFGFIASDRGGKDIFVHASALERAGIAGLMEGQRVAVDVIDGRKGPEAASLRLTHQRPLVQHALLRNSVWALCNSKITWHRILKIISSVRNPQPVCPSNDR